MSFARQLTWCSIRNTRYKMFSSKYQLLLSDSWPSKCFQWSLLLQDSKMRLVFYKGVKRVAMQEALSTIKSWQEILTKTHLQYLKSWGVDFIQLSTHEKAFQHIQYISIWTSLEGWLTGKSELGCFCPVWEEVPHKSIECASCKSSLWIIVPSSQCRGKLGQWPFVLGHLPSRLALVFTLLSSSLKRIQKYSTCD